MITLILYLIKSITVGALLYGCYYWALRRETFLGFNRFYLLTSAALMVILPLTGSLLPLYLLQSGGESTARVFTLPEVVITADRIVTAEQEKAFLDWAFIGYLVITLAMLGGLLLSILRVSRFYRSAMKAEKLEENIYLVEEGKNPFSFMGKIFISPHYAGHPGLKSILAHETAHIRQKHMIDLLLLEFLSSIFWFNPFFFLIKRAVREVHEYLADREVIRQGTESVSYQQILFNEVSGNPQYIIANNFNLNTKNRIVMLIKKSGKYAAVRIGVLLPVVLSAALVIGLLQSRPLSAQTNEVPPAPPVPEVTPPPPPPPPPAVESPDLITQKVVTQKDESKGKQQKPQDKVKSAGKEKEVYTEVDKMPEYPGGMEAMSKYMVESIKYPEAARKKGIHGTVYVSFIIEETGKVTNAKVMKGIGGGCDEEALRVVRGMPDWIPGSDKGKNVRVQFNMPVKFALN